MTEDEFLERWRRERPSYEAWGEFVALRLTDEIRLRVAPVSVDLFVRLPVKPRLKSEGSLVTKAFYRPEKNYDQPFEQITDKVGVRFVVLLGQDIKFVCGAIEACAECNWSKDRDYEVEQAAAPYEFGYQSVHYILRCHETKDIHGHTVVAGTPCEVQVRTLLQHAHNYRDAVDSEADPTRAEVALNEAYFDLAGSHPIDEVRRLLNEKPFIAVRIKERAVPTLLFRQPSILLAYLVASTRPDGAANAWPFTPAELRPIFTDLGVSTGD